MGLFGKFVFLASVLGTAVSFADAKMVPGVLTRISDGDTVVVTPAANQVTDTIVSTKPLKIRVLGLDAPESHLMVEGTWYSQQPFGDEATAELTRIFPPGTAVTVEDHGLDNYGRTLGRLLVGDRDIDLEMVQSGWAIPYFICDGTDCNENFVAQSKAQIYLDACDVARHEGKGVFDPKNTLTEMPFEFRLRIQKRKPERFVADISTHEYFAPADYAKVDLCKRIFFNKEADAQATGFRRANTSGNLFLGSFSNDVF